MMQTQWIPAVGDRVNYKHGESFKVVARSKSPLGAVVLWDAPRNQPGAKFYPLEDCEPFVESKKPKSRKVKASTANFVSSQPVEEKAGVAIAVPWFQEINVALKPDRPQEAAEEESLYLWFLNEFKCPPAPFELNPWRRVTNADRWLPLLRSEVEHSLRFLEGKEERPNPRQRSGALQSELRILKEKYS